MLILQMSGQLCLTKGHGEGQSQEAAGAVMHG